jgi:hypothetical protein
MLRNDRIDLILLRVDVLFSSDTPESTRPCLNPGGLHERQSLYAQSFYRINAVSNPSEDAAVTASRISRSMDDHPWRLTGMFHTYSG